MSRSLLVPLVFLVSLSIAHAQTPRVSILVDLDPGRVDRSVQIESIAADAQGRLYVPDNTVAPPNGDGKASTDGIGASIAQIDRP